MKPFSIPYSIALFFLIAINTLPLWSQNLPLEMRLSADGKRLITGGNVTTGFYDGNTIQEIALTFAQPDYWNQLTMNYSTGTDIPATISINGQSLKSPVGVRFKGQTSYSRLPAGSMKRSFNITLNYTDDSQNIDGYETLNLNNAFEDPSFMREVVYLNQSRKHTPALKGNYARLTINGENWGLYPNIQGLNGEYLDEWFLSNKGTRWRALRTTPAGGGPGGGASGGAFGTGFSSLNYLGADTSEYKKYYTLKKANKPNPWDDLVKTCTVLNNTAPDLLYDSLRHYMDIDRALWTVATEIAFSDDDSYVNKGGMDYYLYWEQETGRIVNLEYDGNTAMRINNAGWSPFYNAHDARFALLYKLLAVPELRQRYLAHMRTLLNESLDQSTVDAVIDKYFNLISPVVQNDPKKIYSYSQFLSDRQVVRNFVTQRRNVILGNSEVNVQGLTVSSLSWTASGVAFDKPAEGEKVTLTAKIQGAAGVSKVNLYYGTGYLGKFERIQMFDDGKNQDGAAGDGTFGAQIPGFPKGTWVRFYVEAIANNTPQTATYYPEGAEHDVFVYQVKLAASFESPVVINEFMAQNTSTVADQDGEFDDWIELYNKSTTAVDLSGWYLTDDGDKLSKWTFPAGTTIGPEKYLIVWADDNGKQAGLHANFKLSASGESLYLLDPSLRIGQEVHFGPQQTDMGYARVPNGTGNFVIQKPTFGANNKLVVSTKDVAGNSEKFIIYPNPATTSVNIKVNSPEPQTVEVYNLIGLRLLERTFRNETVITLDAMIPGLYLVQIGRQVEKLAVL